MKLRRRYAGIPGGTLSPVTTGGVAVTGPPSGLRRAAAFALDQIPVGIYLGVLGALVWAVDHAGSMGLQPAGAVGPWTVQWLVFGLITLPLLMYHACWEGSVVRATPGKLLLGLRVTSIRGGALSLERALLRSGVKFAPVLGLQFLLGVWSFGMPTAEGGLPVGLLISSLVLLVLWALVVARPRGGRGLHDRCAGASVVRVRRSPQVGGSQAVTFPWAAASTSS